MVWKTIVVLASMLVIVCSVAKTGADCPNRDESVLEAGRTCRPQCQTTDDCSGARKRCLCDDTCGMSCFNPNATCSGQESPLNGSVSVSGRTYGQSATFSCDRGFLLFGDRTRVCRSDREWSGQEPTCRASCKVPPSFGTSYPVATASEYELGSTLPIQCLNGFEVTGNAVVTCAEGGRWESGGYRCDLLDCKDPGAPRNGQRTSGDVFTFGSTVYFACNAGYEMQGKNYARCNTEGSWSPALPECRAIECPVPGSPQNGRVNIRGVSDYTYQTQVTYECDDGFTLRGDNIGTCLEDETWGELPTCVIADGCDTPVPPQDGFSTTRETRVPVGDSFTFQCFDGFYMSGSPSVACQSQETLASSVPRCIASVCSAPAVQSPVAIQPQKEAWQVGDIVTYSCPNDYELVGKAVTSCQPNGTWSDVNATCQALPGTHNCPPGFVRDFPFCFKASYEAATYDEARAACRNRSSTLAVIRAASVQAKVSGLKSPRSDEDQSHWIGLRDSQRLGVFVWETGERLALTQYSNFVDRTDAASARTSCAATAASSGGPDRRWMLSECAVERPYICMKWEQSVRSFRFVSPDPHFNGVYFPLNGHLTNGKPTYILRAPSKFSRDHHYILAGADNRWIARRFKESGGFVDMFYTSSPAMTPLNVRSAWKGNDKANSAKVSISEYSKWSQWSEWSACSLTCGAGQQSKTRRCNVPPVGGLLCRGQSRMVRRCNIEACPIQRINNCTFYKNFLNSDVTVVGINGREHNVGSTFPVRCKDSMEKLNFAVANLTCHSGGVWRPSYAMLRCNE